MPKVVGNQSLAWELALTARTFSAAEGEKLGLVSRVVPGSRQEVVQEAFKVARLIVAKSPVAVLGTKRVLLHSRDSTVDENLEYVATWNSATLQTVASILNDYVPPERYLRSYARQDLELSVKAAKAKQTPVYPAIGKIGSKL